MPPTIQALLAARLDQLDANERSVLERGAVEGNIFHLGGVQALSGEECDVPRHLMGLVRKELLRPDRTQFPGDEAFRFRHLLIRDAAYDALPKATRAELHERFADWLESHGGDLVELDEICGYHLEQAHRFRCELGLDDDGLDDERTARLARRAAERLGAAGIRALNRNDVGAARVLMERAVALLAGSERPLELELRLIETRFAGGELSGRWRPRRSSPTRAERSGRRAGALRAWLNAAQYGMRRRRIGRRHAGARRARRWRCSARWATTRSRRRVLGDRVAEHCSVPVDGGRPRCSSGCAGARGPRREPKPRRQGDQLMGPATCSGRRRSTRPSRGSSATRRWSRGDAPTCSPRWALLTAMRATSSAPACCATSRSQRSLELGQRLEAASSAMASTHVELIAGEPAAAAELAVDGCAPARGARRARAGSRRSRVTRRGALPPRDATTRRGRLTEIAAETGAATTSSPRCCSSQVRGRSSRAAETPRKRSGSPARRRPRQRHRHARGTADARLDLAEVLAAPGRIDEAADRAPGGRGLYRAKGHTVGVERAAHETVELHATAQ